jgi:serine/threonine protein kinase
MQEKGDQKTSFDDYYLEGKKLGEGAYAVVRPAHHKETKKVVAIKTFNKLQLITKELKEAVKNEVKIVKKMDHPNIVKFIDKFENRRNIHLVMEHCGDSNLRTKLLKKGKKKLSPSTKIKIFRDIVKAIGYLHQNNIAHCDIKLENIVLDHTNRVKIVDFGFAQFCQENVKSSIISGTQYYMSPELIKREAHHAKKSDVWALGVLLYFILTKKFPFDAKKETDLMLKIIGVEIDYGLVEDELAVQLMKRIFEVDPEKRPGWEELVNSEFLRDGDEGLGSGLAILEEEVKEGEGSDGEGDDDMVLLE